MKRIISLLWVSSALLICLLGSGPATLVPAQDITGSIVGTVTDTNGSAVAGAAVTVRNTDKNIVVRTLTSDSEGRYSAELLPVGHYAITVEAANFKKFTETGIELNVNDRLTVNAGMQVGAQSAEITVEAAPTQVELQDSSASGLISGTEVRELPLNFRNYVQLVTLMPGVTTSLSDQIYIGTTNPLTGATNTISISVNGGRNSQNNWTVDGADNVDRGSNITLLSYPSVDAIAEFKIMRNHYSAEYGRDASGHINVITKSGGNRFHGDVYEFFRNDVLNANNFFNNAAGRPIPPLRYNNFGYTIGGPLYIPGVYNEDKSKTFFFFSQEYRRVITYTTINGTVPTAGELAGNLAFPVCTGPIPTGGTVCPSATTITNINPVAQAYIKDIFSKLPTPNAPALSANTVISNGRNVINSREELFRIDHNFNSKVTASFRFINDSIPSEEPFGLFGPNASVPGIATSKSQSPGRSFVVRSVQTISSNWLNEVGYAHAYGAIISDLTGLASNVNSPDIASIVKLAFPVTLARVPSLSSGFSTITGFGPYRDYDRNNNFFDNVTNTHGAHTFKFGTTINFYQKTENLASGGNNAGTFSFATTPRPTGTPTFEQQWANFLLGNVSTFTQASIDVTPDIRQHEAEFYFQDDYRFKPNLTLNMGLRYSLFRQPFDAHNQLNNFDPRFYDPAKAFKIDPATGNRIPGTGDPMNGIVQAGVNSPFGSKVVPEDNKDFAPVFGFAWDPFKTGKTSIRGGYGLSYDTTLVGTYEQNIATNPPLVNSITISNTRLDNVLAGVTSVSAAPLSLRGTTFDNHTPYVQQWSLDVQREVAKDFIVDVGYFGSKGTHLLGVVDLNLLAADAAIAAGLQTAGTPITAGTATARLNAIRPFLGYTAINSVQNWFNSNYNSFQASVEKRLSGNSLIRGAYTWSRSLTDNQSDRSNAPQNNFNRKAEYGPSVLDRPQVLTVGYVYQIPFLRNQEGLVGHVLGGWELSGISTFQSGLPLTVTTNNNVDPAGIGFLGASAAGPRPDEVGDPNANAPHTLLQWFNTSAFANVPSTVNRPGNAGRGVVRGPGYQRWDVTMAKNYKLGEDKSVQFRAEMFNIFNHTNFNGVSTVLGSPTFGQITSTRDPRIMQFALKFYF